MEHLGKGINMAVGSAVVANVAESISCFDTEDSEPECVSSDILDLVETLNDLYFKASPFSAFK